MDSQFSSNELKQHGERIQNIVLEWFVLKQWSERSVIYQCKRSAVKQRSERSLKCYFLLSEIKIA